MRKGGSCGGTVLWINEMFFEVELTGLVTGFGDEEEGKESIKDHSHLGSWCEPMGRQRCHQLRQETLEEYVSWK